MVAMILRNVVLGLLGGWALSVGAAFPPTLWWQDVKMVPVVGSPAVSVQYKGIKAFRADFKVNGELVGGVALDEKRSEGEFRFRFPLSQLQLGDNLVEVFLLDGEGKVLGSQKVVLSVEKAEGLPVRVTIPRMGETVSGTVEIHVDFGVQTRERYVSFFVDKEFRSLRNYPPFVFYWDTRTVSNGWHEIQVWLFDETQTTYKSPAVRVYVDNPGGRTEHLGGGEAGTGEVSSPPIAVVAGNAVVLKMSPAEFRVNVPTTSPRAPSTAPSLSDPSVAPPMGRSLSTVVGYGLRHEISGHRLAEPSRPREASPAVVESVSSPKGSRLIRVEPGTRLKGEGTFDVLYEGERVNFDVSPRIVGGVPLTPFRHLYEKAGGQVEWDHATKVCTAQGEGRDIWLKIGETYAKVDGKVVPLEMAPYIERGRTMVPLSFISLALKVVIEYDPETGHVLITKAPGEG
ncbi:MAG: hypothetical protein K6T17_03885 [Fimbriimonadales bacterium]|nr:hypothetical protein [Fimbriimonadales bacterium]